MNECICLSLHFKMCISKFRFLLFLIRYTQKAHHSLTIKAACFIAELQQLLVCFVRRSEDKNP